MKVTHTKVKLAVKKHKTFTIQFYIAINRTGFCVKIHSKLRLLCFVTFQGLKEKSGKTFPFCATYFRKIYIWTVRSY